jgi:hypothetical protein
MASLDDLVESIDRDDATLFITSLHGFTDTKRMQWVVGQLLETSAPAILSCVLQNGFYDNFVSACNKKSSLHPVFFFTQNHMPDMLVAWLQFKQQDTIICLPDTTTILLFLCEVCRNQDVSAARI